MCEPHDDDSDAVTVGIIDDDPMICQAMSLILTDYSHGALAVAFTARSVEEGLRLSEGMPPNVVLMDINIPGGKDGIEGTYAFRRLPVPPHVLILTSLSPSGMAERAIEAGAEGFVSKTDPPQEMIQRVLGVQQGSPQFNAGSQRQLLRELNSDKPMQRQAAARAALDSLSERERTAVLLSAQGLRNIEIAEKMFISERTVKAHLSTAADKLGLNRIQLARLVERAGL
ncbi:MAG: response regulator transcription factor [Bifidobacteriaceae bacterium]|jgi:DNA-binding NarL/FixJ family response regulator|nr:response regulator transcription factor [Bifidobacteriaceae bacterium]MCI1979573.1 response regulator transcription factor [Bifidobacteriaceae bacterium]